MDHKNNSPQVSSTYQTQIDAIKSIDDYDLQKVESIILQKKELLVISRDIQGTEKLLAQIDALEWLQVQIVVMTLGFSNNNNGSTRALGI